MGRAGPGAGESPAGAGPRRAYAAPAHRVLRPSISDWGYIRYYLRRGHPLADRSGCCYLHRLCAWVALGRKLDPWEHVHHRTADKTTARFADLSIMHHDQHAHWHYHWHGDDSCGDETPLAAAEHPSRWAGQYHDSPPLEEPSP